MAKIERLSVALPAPMANSVRQAVADGEYASTSEVIRDALRLWQSRRHLLERDADVLRSRWDEGKASGRSGRLDVKRMAGDEELRDVVVERHDIQGLLACGQAPHDRLRGQEQGICSSKPRPHTNSGGC